MRARRICLLTALTFAAVCCTPAGGPAPVAPPPPAGWSGPGPVPPPRRMRLFFGGDVMQHMPQVDAVRRGDGFDYEPVFRTLAPRIRAADLAVVNLETTLTRRSRYTGYPLFRSPAALADALRDAGVDVAVLANNHCCDGGAEGIRTSAAEYATRVRSWTALITRKITRFTSRIAAYGWRSSITPTEPTACPFPRVRW